MKKESCRKVNKCIYCKYWLGERPDPNVLTWQCTYTRSKALCALDSSGALHDSNDLCYKFQKDMIYS